MKWSRRRKWIVAASAAAVAIVLAATIVGRLTVSARLLERLQTGISERYGVEARADDLSLSFLDGTAALLGFRVVEGGVTVLEAERVEISARVRDVLGGRIDVAKLVVVRPVLRVVVEADGRANLVRLLATPRKTPRPDGPEGIVVLRDARVEDGRIEFDDAVTAPGEPMRRVLRNLRAVVTELQCAGEPVTESSADIRVDCEADQPGFPARVSVVAWSRPGDGPATFSLHAAITGYDLRQIPQYVSATQRAAIGGELMNLAVDIEARDGVIEPGAIVGEVAGAGTVLPLRVGGTTDDPVFDLESPLGTLLSVPLTRVGRFGEVALGAGWSALKGGGEAVADLGVGVADAGAALGKGLWVAGGDVVTGDPLGALEAAGGGVVGVATSLGGGLVAGVKSLFGGGSDAVSSFSGADAATLDREFAAIHAARRLAMLRAALASVPDGVAADRRERIEAEIAASPKPADADEDAK
jgi:hypothetical protein